MRRQGYPAQQLGLLGMGLGAMPKLLGQSGVTEQFASPLSVGGDILGLAAGLATGGVFGPLGGAGGSASQLAALQNPSQASMVLRRMGYNPSNTTSLFGF